MNKQKRLLIKAAQQLNFFATYVDFDGLTKEQWENYQKDCTELNDELVREILKIEEAT
jgi:hypothetical protein